MNIPELTPVAERAFRTRRLGHLVQDDSEESFVPGRSFLLGWTFFMNSSLKRG
jgi:hypothetical protein